jgi:hypothetical protein
MLGTPIIGAADVSLIPRISGVGTAWRGCATPWRAMTRHPTSRVQPSTLPAKATVERTRQIDGQGVLKRAILHRGAVALLAQRSNTRRGLYCIGVRNRRSVTTRYPNCEWDPARRQRDDGGPQNPETWLQGEGDEQIEWQVSDGDDYRPRTLCEGPLHRSDESRGAGPWVCWACFGERVTCYDGLDNAYNGLDDTQRTPAGIPTPRWCGSPTGKPIARA